MPKRGGSSSAKAPPTKKGKKEDAIKMRVAKIEHVLSMSENRLVSEMLQSCCEDAFKGDSETRTYFESETIDMIREAITEIHGQAKGEEQLALQRKEEAGNTKADMVQKIETLQNQWEAKKADLKAATQWEEKKADDVKAAVEEQKKFLKTSKSLMNQVQRTKQLMDEARTGWAEVSRLRDHPDSLKDKERKKILSSLTAFLGKMDADDSLASAAPNAYGKKENERSAFDKAVISSVNQAFEKYWQTLTKMESDLAPQVAANEAQSQDLERKIVSAQQILADAKSEVKVIGNAARDLNDILTDMIQQDKRMKKQFSSEDSDYNKAYANLKVVEEALTFVSELSTRVGDNIASVNPQQNNLEALE